MIILKQNAPHSSNRLLVLIWRPFWITVDIVERLRIAWEPIRGCKIDCYDKVDLHTTSKIVNEGIVHVFSEVPQNQLSITLVGFEVFEFPLALSFFGDVLRSEGCACFHKMASVCLELEQYYLDRDTKVSAA